MFSRVTTKHGCEENIPRVTTKHGCEVFKLGNPVEKTQLIDLVKNIVENLGNLVFLRNLENPANWQALPCRHMHGLACYMP